MADSDSVTSSTGQTLPFLSAILSPLVLASDLPLPGFRLTTGTIHTTSQGWKGNDPLLSPFVRLEDISQAARRLFPPSHHSKSIPKSVTGKRRNCRIGLV